MDVKVEAESAPDSAAGGSPPVEAESAPDMPPRGSPPVGPASEPDDPDRPRTKAAQREATVAALMRVARELFAERGYAGVGTEEIVQRAGVTRGALYHHFKGGKEELFRAVLVQLSAEIVHRVTVAASATDDPWEELVLGS